MESHDQRNTVRDTARSSTVPADAAAQQVIVVPELAPRRSAYEQLVKPVIDWVLALVAIVLLSPILLAAAVAVWWQLGTPVLLKQERVGRDGHRFRVLKFRTMHPDRRVTAMPIAFPDRRVNHKDPNDPRLTSIGRFLRGSSIDELPQFLNVLRGDMSLVGPRPELPHIVDRHYAPHHHRRHQVRPGVTGLWQISERGNGLMYEHADVDVDYVDRVSLRTDLSILVRTPIALLQRGRAW